MSLDKKLIALGPAAPGTRTADLGSNPFGDGNCICWIEFDTSITDGTSTQTLTANGSITLTEDQIIFGTTSGYFDSTGAKDIPNKDSITFAAGDGGRSDLDGWTNSNDLSLSVWIYWEGLNQPSNEQAVATILAITNGTGIMCRIFWNNHGTYPNKLDLGSYSDGIQSDTALNINAWNHLVFISPATNSSTESAEIYLNGTRVGYKTNWARGSRNYYDSIGGEFNTVNDSSQYFNGYMDNLRIFKDRLTVSEVEDLYNEGLSPTYADFLVVAGGGSGGRDSNSGGGGAGGLRTSYGSTSGGAAGDEPRLTLTSGTTYTITVGAGASTTANAVPYEGANGSDSSITASGLTTITSLGGGGGVGQYGNTSGKSGGSGGGGGYNNQSGGAGTAGQGYAGGSGQASGDYAGGGGGGAGEAGNTDGQGYGGDGLAVAITGSSVTYAGGGGAGKNSGTGSSLPGGDGGGGQGVCHPNGNTAGAANTGGGGGGYAGGDPSRVGEAGGSGVVILRMATSVYSGTTTGSPTVTTDGSDTILTYTGSGTYVH